jgi:C-terminal processing protease CtpA/Prc
LHLWSGTNAAFLNALQDFVAHARRSGLDGLVLDLLDGRRIEGKRVRPDVVVADTAEGDGPLSAALDAFACKAGAVGDL